MAKGRHRIGATNEFAKPIEQLRKKLQPTGMVTVHLPGGLSKWAEDQLSRRLRRISLSDMINHPTAVRCIMRSVVFRDKHTVHPPKPWPKPVFISEEQNEQNRLKAIHGE